MNGLLQKLLAMRLIQPNAPDPSQGGGLVPSSQWDAPMPPLPKAPMPQLPAPLPPTQGNSAMPPDLPPAPPAPMSASISPQSLSNPSGPSTAPPLPPIKPDPASIAALSGGAPAPPSGPSAGTPDFINEDVQNGRPFPDYPGEAAPAPPPPAGPSMSTPGAPLGGDPSLGMQGPDNMAPPPEPAPLDSAPLDPMAAGLPGQSPQMMVHTASEQGGGGDLVSLIKRLLHKGK